MTVALVSQCRHSRFGSGIPAPRPRKQTPESGAATVDDRFNVAAVETLHLAPDERSPLKPTSLLSAATVGSGIASAARMSLPSADAVLGHGADRTMCRRNQAAARSGWRSSSTRAAPSARAFFVARSALSQSPRVRSSANLKRSGPWSCRKAAHRVGDVLVWQSPASSVIAEAGASPVPSTSRCGPAAAPGASPRGRRALLRKAAGILTHRSDRLDQSGGYGEAFRRLRADATDGRLLAAYSAVVQESNGPKPGIQPGSHPRRRCTALGAYTWRRPDQREVT